MSQPLVSIIIPSYNDSKFLVDSINSALNQKYSNIEVIIVNDGSENKEDIEFFKNFPYSSEKVKLINKNNQGLAAARNTGVINSNGEYFVPLDADDKISSDFIEKTLEIALENQKIGVVYTDQHFFGLEDKIMPMLDFDFVKLLSVNHVSVCSLVKREAYESVRSKNGLGYNLNMIYGYEDWDFWISLGELGWKFKCVHEPLFFYRKRINSMSSNTIKRHDYLINQLIENHKESFTKYSIEIIKILQSTSKNLELLNFNREKDLKSSYWLIKRLLKNLIKK